MTVRAKDAAPSDIEVFGAPQSVIASVPKSFLTLGYGHYQLVVAAYGIRFDLDRLRRERGELVGELSVSCSLPGVPTVDGTLSVADFNVSSIRTRSDRAKILAQRAPHASEVDWLALLEEMCQRTITAERAGTPPISLRDIARPPREETWTIDGISLLPRHPAILFGDGGTAKSYLALYLLGTLARCGVKVGLFDWELAPEDHRDRLERLFGADMPDITYVRCERPLVHETDGLRRTIRDAQLEYVVFDSIAFACDGPPEAAEVAGAYYRALRQLGTFGSLHIAHITKGEGGEHKPFGSAFWHNGARATWHMRMDQAMFDGALPLTVSPKKCNLGPVGHRAINYRVVFDKDTQRTQFIAAESTEIRVMSVKPTAAQRVAQLLISGPSTKDAIVNALCEEFPAGTLRQAISRGLQAGDFEEMEGRISLSSKQDA